MYATQTYIHMLSAEDDNDHDYANGAKIPRGKLCLRYQREGSLTGYEVWPVSNPHRLPPTTVIKWPASPLGEHTANRSCGSCRVGIGQGRKR